MFASINMKYSITASPDVEISVSDGDSIETTKIPGGSGYSARGILKINGIVIMDTIFGNPIFFYLKNYVSPPNQW